MKKKSLTKNYILDMIYRIITLVVPLITAPYISRHIGVEGIGNFSYTQSINSYFTFVAILGSNIYGQREIAFCNGNKDEITRKFWSIFCCRFIFTTLTTIAYLVFVLHTYGVIRVLLLIQVTDIIGQIFDINWLYQGLEEFGKILARNIIMKTISVVSIFFFVNTADDLYIYVFIVSFANVFSNMLMFFSLKKYVKKPVVLLTDIKNHIRPILKLFFPTIALNLYNQIDKTMIGYLSFSDEAGYYEQATKIIVIINTFVTSVCNVMSPRIASLIKIGNVEETRKLNRKTFELIWLLALPIAFGLFAISDYFVPLFFGKGFEKVSILLKILSVICMPMGIKMILGMQFLIPNKLEKEYTKSIFLGTVVNVILNSILIHYWGAIGAAISSICSEIVIICCIIIDLRGILCISDIFSGVTKKTISAVIMFMIICVLIPLIKIDILKIIIPIFVGASSYFIILIIIKDEFIWQIMKKYMTVIKKRRDV